MIVILPSPPWRVRILSWTTLTTPAKIPSTSVTWRPWGEVTKCSQCNTAVSVSQAQQLTWPTTSTGHPMTVKPTVGEVFGPSRCITSQVCWQHVQHLLLYDHLPIRTEVEAHACPVGRRRDQMYTDQRMSRYIITPPSILAIVTQYFASVRLWFGSLYCFNTSYSSFAKEEIIMFALMVFIDLFSAVPLGMEDGTILDRQISASSERRRHFGPANARLNFSGTGGRAGGWVAGANDKNQWLQVDFGNETRVTGIDTQGRSSNQCPKCDQWVKNYTVSYSQDNVTFHQYKQDGRVKVFQTELWLPRTRSRVICLFLLSFLKEFQANSDRDSIVHNVLSPPVVARYIRIKPTNWSGSITMRVEFRGCRAGMGHSHLPTVCEPRPVLPYQSPAVSLLRHQHITISASEKGVLLLLAAWADHLRWRYLPIPFQQALRQVVQGSHPAVLPSLLGHQPPRSPRLQALRYRREWPPHQLLSPRLQAALEISRLPPPTLKAWVSSRKKRVSSTPHQAMWRCRALKAALWTGRFLRRRRPKQPVFTPVLDPGLLWSPKCPRLPRQPFPQLPLRWGIISKAWPRSQQHPLLLYQ